MKAEVNVSKLGLISTFPKFKTLEKLIVESYKSGYSASS